MKAKEREEARRLRTEEGLSVGEIATRLGVSKGTSSLWLRDIELTDEQKVRLAERGHGQNEGQIRGSLSIKEQAKSRREDYQQTGREMAKRFGFGDYRVFCALYWAEGNKSRCCVGMSNTDPDMLRIFVKVLREVFESKDDDFGVSVMAHLGNGLTAEQIRDYWLNMLGLPEKCFKRFNLKSKYYPAQNKKHKRHVYGCCSVRIGSTEIVQTIYGSIQEFFGIDRPEWLWG
jgi:transposase-like protein